MNDELNAAEIDAALETAAESVPELRTVFDGLLRCLDILDERIEALELAISQRLIDARLERLETTAGLPVGIPALPENTEGGNDG